jgi:hypothetical protein
MARIELVVRFPKIVDGLVGFSNRVERMSVRSSMSISANVLRGDSRTLVISAT